MTTSSSLLYFDCFSGISGDMTVGVLRDLGVEEKVFQDALTCLGLGDEFHIQFRRDARQGISGWKFDVHVVEPPSSAPFHIVDSEHPLVPANPIHLDSGHVHGRSFAAIRSLLEESTLSSFVKKHAVGVFRRIADAEGRIHGQPPEEVAFHEVGAVDSLADIVAACAGLESLGVKDIRASRLVVGSGWVDCAHGRFPLPAPATLEILQGIPLRQIEEPHELITPTGAALLAEFSTSFGLLPEMCIEKTGYGLGTRNTGPRPNVLRAMLGKQIDSSDAEADEITQIECNLDDSTPELAGAAMERLFAAGALDVFFTAAQMKKNRPGWVLTVLASEENSSPLARIILRETSAFGLRMHRTRRLKLRRAFHDVETRFGPVRLKLGYLGDSLVQSTPEYDSCRQLAETTGVSVRDVYLAALQAVPSVVSS